MPPGGCGGGETAAPAAEVSETSSADRHLPPRRCALPLAGASQPFLCARSTANFPVLHRRALAPSNRACNARLARRSSPALHGRLMVLVSLTWACASCNRNVSDYTIALGPAIRNSGRAFMGVALRGTETRMHISGKSGLNSSRSIHTGITGTNWPTKDNSVRLFLGSSPTSATEY